MTARRSKSIRHAGGIIRPTPCKTFRAEICADGKRFRYTAKTIDQARTWLELERARIESPTAISPADYHDACRARAMLPDSVTFLDVARFWVQHNAIDSPTMIEAADAWLEHKSALGLRPRTYSSARSRINTLAESMQSETVASITTDRLAAWLKDRELGGKSRNNYRTTWGDFFNWCRRRNWCASNPAAELPVFRADQAIPAVLTIEQTRKLLSVTIQIEPKLIAYTVLGLFAGIRPEELARLQWSAIGDTIHIGPGVAKIRMQRFVSIPPNLAAWLRCCKSSGPICPLAEKTRARRLQKIRAAVMPKWEPDVMRHSFGSYHLALHRDSGLTAHEMGHQSPSTLYAHYRALASMTSGENFFRITPASILDI